MDHKEPRVFTEKQWAWIKENSIWWAPVLISIGIILVYAFFAEDAKWSTAETWKDFASYFSGMATPIVTFVAVFIAFKQLKQADKHRLDQEDKRADEEKLARVEKSIRSEIEYFHESTMHNIKEIERHEAFLIEKHQTSIHSIIMKINNLLLKASYILNNKDIVRIEYENQVAEILISLLNISSITIRTSELLEMVNRLTIQIGEHSILTSMDNSALQRRTVYIAQQCFNKADYSKKLIEYSISKIDLKNINNHDINTLLKQIKEINSSYSIDSVYFP